LTIGAGSNLGGGTGVTATGAELTGNMFGRNGGSALRIIGDGTTRNFQLDLSVGNRPVITGAVAFSFWAKTTRSTNMPVVYAGTGDSNNNQLIYAGALGPVTGGDALRIATEWTRYIIPLPAAFSNGRTITRPFFVRFQAAIGVGSDVYFDDIEYLTEGVTLTDIELKATSVTTTGDDITALINNNPTNTATGNLMVLKYQHTDGTIGYGWSSKPSTTSGVQTDFRAHIAPELEWVVTSSSLGTASSASNGTVTFNKLSTGTGTIQAKIGSVLSNAVDLTVTD